MMHREEAEACEVCGAIATGITQHTGYGKTKGTMRWHSTCGAGVCKDRIARRGPA